MSIRVCAIKAAKDILQGKRRAGDPAVECSHTFIGCTLIGPVGYMLLVERTADNLQLMLTAQFHAGNSRHKAAHPYAGGAEDIFLDVPWRPQHFAVKDIEYIRMRCAPLVEASVHQRTRYLHSLASVGPRDFGIMLNVLDMPSCESR